MKLFWIFAAVFAAAGSAAGPELAGIKAVYMLPMSSGLDQYLAVRLTSASVFEVVTDPQKADAIFTDHIGASLEQTLHQLYEIKPKPADKDAGKDKSGAASDDDVQPTMAPLSRGKGSVFLVDRKTRAIVWSMYARPKSTQADDMNHLAQRIAERLEKDRKGK